MKSIFRTFSPKQRRKLKELRTKSKKRNINTPTHGSRTPQVENTRIHHRTELDPIIERKWVKLSTEKKKQENEKEKEEEEEKEEKKKDYDFSLATQNILADRYVSFNRYNWVEPKYLYQRYRHRKLHQTLRHYDFDIICLQELQGVMHKYLMKKMHKEYESVYKHITHFNAWEPASDRTFEEKFSDRFEGVGIFWKTKLFELVCDPLEIEFNKLAWEDTEGLSESQRKKVISSVCQNSHNIALAVLLKHKETGKHVCVTTIHGYYRKERYIAQTYQCEAYFKRLKNWIEEKDEKVDAKLCCGDFNIYNTSKALKFIENGTIQIDERNEELKEINVYKILKREPKHELEWRRSYHPKLKPFSHFSARLKQKDVIDYIFRDRGVNPVENLRISEKEIKGIFPNRHQNSDHLLLASKYVFKKD